MTQQDFHRGGMHNVAGKAVEGPSGSKLRLVGNEVSEWRLTFTPRETKAGEGETTQVRLGILAVGLLALAGCAAPTPTATPTPEPTATPTPTPLPALYASAEARECLLRTECSGLFAVEKVRKAPILNDAQPRYWLAPDGTTAWETVIRERVMPTLEAWTAREWREIENPDDGALQWRSNALRIHSWGWTGGCEIACAVSGDLRIVVRPDTGHPYFDAFPSEVLYRIALHEALHALWYARHAASGLMCADDYCPDVEQLTANGEVWWIAGFPDVLHEVYTLYAHPALTDGMDLDAVFTIVEQKE